MKVGDKVKILYMDGEPEYDGRKGTVTHIDDAGQIHGTWGGCALIPGVDEYEVIANQDVKLFCLGLATYGAVYIVLTILEQFLGISV